MNTKKSSLLFDRAKQIIPGGVNSPVRAYKAIGMTPPFIQKAYGSKILDVDNNLYIDYIGSWGPMILGHADPEVLDAIREAVENGTSYGAPTQGEVELAALICEALPSVEMVRMVSSGTEAVMSAIRLARGYTGRDKILKFEGGYHGHADGLLVKAGSGALTTGVPDSAGIPLDYARNTLTSAYNDCEGLQKVFETAKDTLAAVIVEPIAGNMGVIPPLIEFLKMLRDLTHQYGALLIFDEVITGFRAAYNGAQGLFGIKPDLTTLGKIVGGGMPVGAYGGRRDIMQKISPMGPVYQAGTLSGNPVAMAAGIKTLEILKGNPSIYEALEEKGNHLEKAFHACALRHGVPLTVNRVGSVLTPFFTEDKVTDYKTATRSDIERYAQYFRAMFEEGIYLPPSQYEAMFLSAAHDQQDLEKTIQAIDRAFAQL